MMAAGGVMARRAALPGGARKPATTRKPATSEKAPRAARASLAVAALQLLGRWQRVCSGHLSFTNGCACGIGATVDLGELDDLIIDYLRRKFAAEPVVAGYIGRHDVAGGMKSLLRALATDGDTLSTTQAQDLMAAIEASVVSIEEQHRT